MVVRISGEHNHDSNIVKKATTSMVKTAVKEAAKNLTVAPKTILQNVTNEVMGAYSNVGVNTLPKQITFNKMIQHKRMKGFNCPPLSNIGMIWLYLIFSKQLLVMRIFLSWSILWTKIIRKLLGSLVLPAKMS